MKGIFQRYRRAVQDVARKVLIASGGGEELMTVAEGWEAYAKQHRSNPRLGEEWNKP
jgi:hypothetical protein